MARQNKSTAAATSTDETATAPVEGTTPPVEGTTETPAPAADTKVEMTDEQITEAVNGYLAAVEALFTEADETTGTLPEATLGEVTKAFQALDGVKLKNAARKAVNAKIIESVMSDSHTLGRTWADANAAQVTAKASSTPKAPADPTAAFVQRVASLRLGLNLAELSVDGEKVAADWSEQADKLVADSVDATRVYIEWLNTEVPEGTDKPEMPETSPMVRAAVKLSTGKGSAGRASNGGAGSRPAGGPQGDVAKHILEVLEAAGTGKELKVSEIAKAGSSQYAAGTVSGGAVTARLFPTSGKACTVEGVTPIERDSTGPRRVKLAS